MKKVIIFFALITSALSFVFGQEKNVSNKWTDVSVFNVRSKQNPNVNRPIMWFSHEEGKYFIEGRMNFDQKETGTLLVGKTFTKKETFWITPKIGMFLGLNNQGYDGFSFETNLGGKVKKIRYFSMFQYAKSTNKNSDFLYNFTQIGYKFSKNFQLNYSGQIFIPTDGSGVWIDQGPQLNISINDNIWIRPWYTWDPNRNLSKLVIGLGYHF